MKKSIHHTIIPEKYNPALVRGTAEWARAFNHWSMYIRGEVIDNRMVVEAKKILDNVNK